MKNPIAWGFLGRLLGLILKNGLSLMANVLKPLAKSVLRRLDFISWLKDLIYS